MRVYNRWPLSRVKVREDLSEKQTFKDLEISKNWPGKEGSISRQRKQPVKRLQNFKK